MKSEDQDLKIATPIRKNGKQILGTHNFHLYDMFDTLMFSIELKRETSYYNSFPGNDH